MKKVILLAGLLLLSMGAVNAQTKTGKPIKPKSTQRLMWLLMIDFVSKGSGIDNDAFTKIEDFAKNHPQKPAYNVNNAGKEGEKKMYFSLKELDEAERAAFVEEIKKLVSKPDMVIVNSKLPKKKKGVPTASAEVKQGETYRLVISFISKGAGTDNPAQDKVRNYIETHIKKPAFEVKSWGREGEKDYLLNLKEFTADEQKVFVDEVKKLISSSDLVILKENETYVKKGR